MKKTDSITESDNNDALLPRRHPHSVRQPPRALQELRLLQESKPSHPRVVPKLSLLSGANFCLRGCAHTASWLGCSTTYCIRDKCADRNKRATLNSRLSPFQGEVRRAPRPGVQEGHSGTSIGEWEKCRLMNDQLESKVCVLFQPKNIE